jgi:PPM family protein phosphatase
MKSYEIKKENNPKFEVGIADVPLKGEDTFIRRDDIGLFGVFDGAGGSGDGQFAANIASGVFSVAMIKQEVYDSEDSLDTQINSLVGLLQNASNNVAKTTEGVTTGTVARIIEIKENDQISSYLIWASAGDSRIYLYRDGEASQLSVDEGFGHQIYNYLGHGLESDEPKTVKQSGFLKVIPSDKIILVTDGITGDVEPDLLSEKQIAEVCGDEPQNVVKRLVEISSKKDDKTALVVEIK